MEIWNIRSVCRNISLYHAHLCMGGTICAVQTQTACEGGSVFVRYVIYTAVTGVIWYGTDRLCLFADGGRVIVFLKRFFICAVVPSLVMLLCFCHTKEFGIVKRKALAIWKRGGQMEEKIKRKNLYCAVFWMQHYMQNRM